MENKVQKKSYKRVIKVTNINQNKYIKFQLPTKLRVSGSMSGLTLDTKFNTGNKQILLYLDNQEDVENIKKVSRQCIQKFVTDTLPTFGDYDKLLLEYDISYFNPSDKQVTEQKKRQECEQQIKKYKQIVEKAGTQLFCQNLIEKEGKKPYIAFPKVFTKDDQKVVYKLIQEIDNEDYLLIKDDIQKQKLFVLPSLINKDKDVVQETVVRNTKTTPIICATIETSINDFDSEKKIRFNYEKEVQIQAGIKYTPKEDEEGNKLMICEPTFKLYISDVQSNVDKKGPNIARVIKKENTYTLDKEREKDQLKKIGYEFDDDNDDYQEEEED